MTVVHFLSSLIVIVIAITIQNTFSAKVRPGSTSTYDKHGIINITRPALSEKDDLLFLFLSRSDDGLPVNLTGWKLATSCLKKKNSVRNCAAIDECDEIFMWNEYCYSGEDLGTVVFYRKVTDNEPSFYYMNIIARYGRPAWAILSAVKNADITSENPIRSVSTTSCDKTNHSSFPSAYGKKDDLLLLSLTYDDKAVEQNFVPPNGTKLESYISGRDEAGFLYSKELSAVGETGEMNTTGVGIKYRCKDAMISLVVRRRIAKVLTDVIQPFNLTNLTQPLMP